MVAHTAVRTLRDRLLDNLPKALPAWLTNQRTTKTKQLANHKHIVDQSRDGATFSSASSPQERCTCNPSAMRWDGESRGRGRPPSTLSPPPTQPPIARAPRRKPLGKQPVADGSCELRNSENHLRGLSAFPFPAIHLPISSCLSMHALLRPVAGCRLTPEPSDGSAHRHTDRTAKAGPTRPLRNIHTGVHTHGRCTFRTGTPQKIPCRCKHPMRQSL